jgi:hypothetical protein
MITSRSLFLPTGTISKKVLGTAMTCRRHPDMQQSRWSVLNMSLVRLVGWVITVPVLLGSLAHADLLYLDSRSGLPTGLGPVTVAISPHPAWQPDNPANPGDASDHSAVWISFADTGYSGSVLQPYQGTTPVVSVFDTFLSDSGTLKLDVWADDTADVLLDGSYLIHAVFTQSTCSGQAIGCRPQDVGKIVTPLSAGSHTLEFVLYQVGKGTDTTTNPFGLLYSGTAPAAPVPEPASCLLFGTVMCCLGWIQRRRKSAGHRC